MGTIQQETDLGNQQGPLNGPDVHLNFTEKLQISEMNYYKGMIIRHSILQWQPHF